MIFYYFNKQNWCLFYLLFTLVFSLRFWVNYKSLSKFDTYNKMKAQRILIFLSVVYSTLNVYTTAPTWLTSSYLQAGNANVINTLTGNSSTPTYAFTFSPSFTQVPNLGYGIGAYQGNDYLGPECFEIQRANLTMSGFGVKVQINCYTNIWKMNIPYIAIDKDFPHHLNSFDNVPVNYSAGPLVNITQNVSYLTEYKNEVNYTAQVGGSSIYDKFTPPYTNTKILLYMTSLFVNGDNEPYGATILNPVELIIDAYATSNTTYEFHVTLQIRTMINRLHFSMIVFDQKDVQGSGNYVLVYKRISLGRAGGFIPIPIQFMDNLIIGFTDFTSEMNMNRIEFQFIFQNNASGVYGAHMPPPSGSDILLRNGFTVFYLKTFQCPTITNMTLFFDNLNDICTQCPVPNCKTCLNISACDVCKPSYVLNNSTLLCQFCSVTGCITCSSASVCILCNSTDGYYLSSGTCLQCNQASGYFLNVSSGACQLCSLSYCVQCSSLTQCAQCNTTLSYYLESNFLCNYCNSSTNDFIASPSSCQPCTLNGCVICSSLTACAVCNNTQGYFIVGVLCVQCSLSNCLVCNSLTECRTCNESNFYYLNTTSKLCEQCLIEGCLSCFSNLTCSSCDPANYHGYYLSSGACYKCNESLNLFLNVSGQTCSLCSLNQCTRCEVLHKCAQCNIALSFYLETDFLCHYCDPSTNHFINPTTLGCQACSLFQCINCTNLLDCRQCNETANYFLNYSNFQCYFCTIPYCVTCESLTRCKLCNQVDQYFLNSSTGLCEPCLIEHCLNCSSLISCYECDTANDYGHDFTSVNYSLCGTCNVSCICDGYVMPWNGEECSSKCGDGLIRINETCDDNNTDQYDGCSSDCQVQHYYECIGQPSNCTQTIFMIGSLMSIEKDGCNSFKIRSRLQGNLPDDISQHIFFKNKAIKVTKVEMLKQEPSFIHIYGQYSQDLINKTIAVIFTPGNIESILYDPAMPPLYYQQNQCQVNEQLKKLVTSSTALSYATLILSLFCGKIVGLQLFGVLQLSYFTLGSHSFLNLYLEPLVGFRSLNGLNINMNQQNKQGLPKPIKSLGMGALFLNNCNIMMLAFLVFIVVSAFMYLLSKIVQPHRQFTYLALLKQGLITFLLFNILNVSFSTGLHFAYADRSSADYLSSSIVLVVTLMSMFISIVALQFSSSQGFGQFKNKFKQNFVCLAYISLSVIWKISIGIYIAVRVEYEYSTLVAVGLCFIYLLYFFINLPFANAYQNYRSALIHITELFILATTNYYRSLKSNTPIEVKARIFTPAIVQLVLLVGCIVVSLLVLFYEVYLHIKHCREGKKTVQARDLSLHKTQETFIY